MSRSVQSGIASVLLYALFYALMCVANPNGIWAPLAFICLILSGVIGVLAARNGSKWWLAISAIATLTLVGGFILGSLAE